MKDYKLVNRIVAENGEAGEKKELVLREVELTFSLKELAEALGHEDWTKNSEYLDGDSYDDVYHLGYNVSDVKNMNLDLSEELEGADWLFPLPVLRALEGGEREAIATELGKARRYALEQTLERIETSGEYAGPDGEMISLPKGEEPKVVSVDRSDEFNTGVKVVLKNPEHLINDLVGGVGRFYAEMNPYTPVSTSDEELKAGFLTNVGSFFDVYGARQVEPREVDGFNSFDRAWFHEQVKENIANLDEAEIVEAIQKAVDSDKDPKDVIETASRLTGKEVQELKSMVTKALKDKYKGAIKKLRGPKDEE